MEGINPDLIGITADEYSDFMAVNTANILDISGYRLYTQLSNLGTTGTDAALAEDAVDNDLLIGGVMPFRDMGNIGAILWRNKDVRENAIGFWDPNTVDAGTGFVDLVTIGQNGEWESTDIDDSGLDRTIEKQSGEAYDNRGDISITALAGLGSLLPVGELGLRLGYSKNVTNDISREYSSSYEDEGDANNYATAKFSSEEQDYTSVLMIAPSIRGLSLMGADLGATVELAMVKQVANTERDATYTEGDTFVGGVGVSDDYARKFKAENTEELTGMRMGLSVDGSYPLNDSVNIKGLVGFRTGKLTGDNSVSSTDEVTKDDGNDAAVEKVSFNQDISKEEKQTNIRILAGIDKQVSDNLLLGIGLGLSREALETVEDEGREVLDTDGTKSYTGIGAAGGLGTSVDETTVKSVATVITLPIGLEWTANSWLKARLGASYAITYRKEETETVTITYEDDSKDAGVDDKTTTTTTNNPLPTRPANDAVNFYAGVGFLVTENLTVDVTNMAVGNILLMNNWRLSATLKF